MLKIRSQFAEWARSLDGDEKQVKLLVEFMEQAVSIYRNNPLEIIGIYTIYYGTQNLLFAQSLQIN